MNKFTISLKKDGIWQGINATPVFPFSWGELLDERLDEAYITVYDSPEKSYKRLTDVKISINNGNKVKDEYFIIASDSAQELPVGSGIYKHEIYLIERTKLLEGIFCSSITFTNSKGAIYTDLKVPGEASWVDLGSQYEYSAEVPKDFVSTIPMALIEGVPTVLPSAKELAEEMHPYINDPDSFMVDSYARFPNSTYPLVKYNSGCSYANAESIATLGYDEPISITPKGTIILTYTLCYSQRIIAGTTLEYYFQAYFLQFRIAAVQNKFPLKRWTITDCITRACELAEPLFIGEVPKYRLEGVEYDSATGNVIRPFPENSLAAKYDKVFAPEFTATEDTLREQLKLILSYVHAEPWLDENDVIRVTEYGSTVQSPAGSLNCVYNAESSHINEYCTEVRSFAKNLVSSLGYARGVITDPGSGIYRSVRSDTAYVRINENNAIAQTFAPIQEIESVYCGIANSDGTGWERTPVDITRFVFEETEYSANLSSYSGAYPLSKEYAIYYTQGAPNLKGLFYKAPNAINTATFSHFAISNIIATVKGHPTSTPKIIDDLLEKDAAALVFSITYKPISNHFVSHGKQLYVPGETPYMQLYNQSESLVESQYFGENLKGVAARLGNVEKERTFILKDIDDVPKVGQILDGYAISAVSCELYPFDIKCTVGLSKDFNRISEYVGINSQKRMYEISERSAVERALLIKETLVIGTRPENYDSYYRIFSDITPFLNIFKEGSSNTGYKISLAAFEAKSILKKPVAKKVYLPVIARSLGNVVTFNFAMKDNYSAGTKTQQIQGDKDVQGRWENDVPYSNYYGRTWFADVSLYGGNIGNRINDAQVVTSLAYSLPSEGDAGGAISELTPLATFRTSHLLRKDNRERISYNIELDIKSDREDIIIGSALADLCGWVNDSNVTPVLYYFDTSEKKIGKFDKVYTTNASGSAPFDVFENSDGSFTVRIKSISTGTSYGWVICTPIQTETEIVENEYGEAEEVSYQTGGEILLASNKAIEGYALNLDFYVVKY